MDSLTVDMVEAAACRLWRRAAGDMLPAVARAGQ
jgi:hypothetical protein